MNIEKMQKKRLINTINFICHNVTDLSIMKLDKLLYFFDLETFKLTGHVPTGLSYYTEENGPAPKTLNNAILKNDGNFFNGKLAFEAASESNYTAPLKILNCGQFEEEFFSASQLRVLKEVVSKYSNLSATDLSDLTHQSGSPYDLTVQTENGMGKVIDFCLALNEDSEITAEYVKDELGYTVG